MVLTHFSIDWKPSRLGCHLEPIRMACCAYVMCTSSPLPQLVAASSSKGCFVRNSVLTIIPLTEYKSCLELPLLQKPLARFVPFYSNSIDPDYINLADTLPYNRAYLVHRRAAGLVSSNRALCSTRCLIISNLLDWHVWVNIE